MWRFHQMAEGEENVNPVQGEFFASEDVGDIADSLVREAIQNSLDARCRRSDGPAEVMYSYGYMGNAETRFEADEIFDGLRQHIQSHNSGIDKLPTDCEGLDFVCVEDFGTKGLEGDPSFNDLSAPLAENENNDFFYFWRNIGRNRKQSDDLGSHGLGKHVFCASSRINTYFGLTCRLSDEERLLMGKAILNIHHCPSKFAPYGYYGQFKEGSDFALPIENREKIDKFCEKFKLLRGDSCGLSVVVPYPKLPLLDCRNIIRATVVHFFYPILKGVLKVTVRYPEQNIDINSHSICSVAEKYIAEDPSLQQLLELSAWAVGRAEDAYINVGHDVDLELTPKWGNLEFRESEERDLRSKFQKGEKLAVRVFVRVKRKDEEPVRSAFNVFIWKTELEVKARGKFIRQGIDVLNANTSRLDTGIVGIVEVHDTPLAELLRVSEPPAHDRWEQQNVAEVTERYERGPSTIGFVKDSLHQLARRLSKRESKRDPDLLREIFSVQLSSDEKTLMGSSGRKKRKKKPEKSGPGEMESTKKPMVNTTIINTDEKCGFRVLPASDDGDVPADIRIKLAYHVGKGNPFNNYSPHDFCLEKRPIKIEVKNCILAICQGNELLAKVTDHEFRIEVTGFDKQRDLIVKVKPRRVDDDS